jgi:nitroreductase
MLKELVQKNRSYRRFFEEKEVTKQQLLELIDIARQTPSGANRQPTRFIISCEKEKNEKIFTSLRWAGYYEDWDGPEAGERPSAYIIMVSPKEVNAAHDEGIIGQTILLSAVEQGLGGCFIGNIDREKLSADINVPDGYAIKLVIALGFPKEKVCLEEISKDGDIHYYRDEEKTQHVPKICLKNLIIE